MKKRLQRKNLNDTDRAQAKQYYLKLKSAFRKFEEAIDNVKYGLDEDEEATKKKEANDELDFLADPEEKKQSSAKKEEKNDVDLLDLDVQNNVPKPTYQPKDDLLYDVPKPTHQPKDDLLYDMPKQDLVYDAPKNGVIYEKPKEEPIEYDAFACIEIENLDPKKKETTKKDTQEQKQPEEEDAFAFLDMQG